MPLYLQYTFISTQYCCIRQLINLDSIFLPHVLFVSARYISLLIIQSQKHCFIFKVNVCITVFFWIQIPRTLPFHYNSKHQAFGLLYILDTFV